MRQGKLVRLSNVIEADEAIQYLLKRPKLELVGLGLIYGRPGLGKTTYAQRIASERGYLYLRLESTLTTKTFARMLLDALQQRVGDRQPIIGSSHTLFMKCLNILEDHPEFVIIIDEIDYAFQNMQLLGAIRDIVDETLAIVILVGMQNARMRLMQLNEYYFDRVNKFVEFKPATRKDIAMLCAGIMEVEPSDGIVDYLLGKTDGTLRNTMKLIHSIETVAREHKAGSVSVNDLDSWSREANHK